MKTKFLSVLLITLAVIGLSWIYVDRLTSIPNESTNQYFYLSEGNQNVTPSVDMSKIDTKKANNRKIKQRNKQFTAPKVTNQPVLAKASGGSSKVRAYSSTSSSTGSSNIFTKSSSNHIYSTNSGNASFMAVASKGGKSSNGSNSNNNNNTGTLNAGIANVSAPFAASALSTSRGSDKPVLIDPGTDPRGAPIPVGNGFLLLVLMSGFYGIYLLKLKK